MQGWVDLCYMKATGRELNPRHINRKSNALPLSHHATRNRYVCEQLPGPSSSLIVTKLGQLYPWPKGTRWLNFERSRLVEEVCALLSHSRLLLNHTQGTKRSWVFLSFLNVDWPQLSSVVLAVSHMTPVWSAAANGKTSLKWLTSKCQSGPGAERWTGQGCRWTSDSLGLVRQYGTPRGDAFRNTWQAAQAYFPPSPYIALTPHTPIQKVSALGSRVGWTPARKEWTNERPTSMSSVTKKLNFISSVLKGIVCFSPCIVVCDRIATLYVTYACIID